MAAEGEEKWNNKSSKSTDESNVRVTAGDLDHNTDVRADSNSQILALTHYDSNNNSN